MPQGLPTNDETLPKTLVVTSIDTFVKDALGDRYARRFGNGLKRDVLRAVMSGAPAGVEAQCLAIETTLSKIEGDLNRPIDARVHLRGFLNGRPFDTNLHLLRTD